MSLDFAIDTALGSSVIWAAVSLPLLYLNPLKFPDDEKTTSVLVYVVGPFMFLSVILVIVNFMRRRSQTRDEARKMYLKADLMYQSLRDSEYYLTLPAEYKNEAGRLFGHTLDAVGKGAHEEAKISAQQLITLIRNRPTARMGLRQRGDIEEMI